MATRSRSSQTRKSSAYGSKCGRCSLSEQDGNQITVFSDAKKLGLWLKVRAVFTFGAGWQPDHGLLRREKARPMAQSAGGVHFRSRMATRSRSSQTRKSSAYGSKC